MAAVLMVFMQSPTFSHHPAGAAPLLRSKGHWPREAEFTAASKFVALDHPDPPKRFPIEFERKSFYSPGLATCAGASLGNAEVLKHVLHPIHPDGWKFVAIFVAVTLGLFFLWEPLGWVGVVASAWCVYFFRDPPRVTPQRAGLVVSPADGLVVSVGSSFPPIELEMGMRPMTKIGIFLNVFDVHINRAPIGGTVTALPVLLGTVGSGSVALTGAGIAPVPQTS